MKSKFFASSSTFATLLSNLTPTPREKISELIQKINFNNFAYENCERILIQCFSSSRYREVDI